MAKRELMGKTKELIYDENMNEELICQHCNWPTTDDDRAEIRYGMYIHISCEIEYYSGLK